MLCMILKLLGIVSSAVLFGAAPALAEPAPRIVGGQVATASYPWITALITDAGKQGCPAELISPKWLLTAALCADKDIAQFKARVGSLNRTRGGTVVGIVRGIRHPDYHESTSDNDIALVELAEPVTNKPVVLADATDWEGKTLRSLGWGQTCAAQGCNDGADRLLRVDNEVAGPKTCRAEGTNYNPDHELCMKSTATATVCFGDSGGPTLDMATTHLVGVISHGSSPRCGDQDSLVTRVQPYLKWIKSYTG